MIIPLFNRLKKSSHRKIALLQDELIDVIYSVSPKAVFHGGTAIWRCYSGNRFSEDLDFYLLADELFKKKFFNEINARGLKILKYKKTSTTVFCKISDNETEIRFEAAERKKNFVARSYEKLDGNDLTVFTLSAEDLLEEKMNAFLNRKLIRDLYDVYFLSKKIEGIKSKKLLKEFIKKIETIKPLDEKNLKTIIYSGAVPSFNQMIEVLKRRC